MRPRGLTCRADTLRVTSAPDRQVQEHTDSACAQATDPIALTVASLPMFARNSHLPAHRAATSASRASARSNPSLVERLALSLLLRRQSADRPVAVLPREDGDAEVILAAIYDELAVVGSSFTSTDATSSAPGLSVTSTDFGTSPSRLHT
jgi:hypothetical protein